MSREHGHAVIPVNALTFEQEVLNERRTVLVDVSATWCGPCRMAAPVVSELARQHAGRLKVVIIDGDESPELVAKLGVRGFPTFLGFSGGREVERSAGFGGAAHLRAFATRLLSGTSAALSP